MPLFGAKRQEENEKLRAEVERLGGSRSRSLRRR